MVCASSPAPRGAEYDDILRLADDKSSGTSRRSKLTASSVAKASGAARRWFPAWPGRRMLRMATRSHTVELQPDSYALVEREAERRGVRPDALVDDLVRNDLSPPPSSDLDDLLRRAAEFRAMLPPIDAVALARESRDELEARSA